MEDAWHWHFESALNRTRAPLHTLFGPYIPLFIDWCSHTLFHGDLVPTLKRVLRPNVAYITVSVNDDGPTGTTLITTYPNAGYAWSRQMQAVNNSLRLRDLPNLLVLSSGGYGHVPIPEMKVPVAPLHERLPMEKRRYLVSFVGSLVPGGPGHPTLRNRMKYVVQNASAFLGFNFSICSNIGCEVQYGADWKTIMSRSRVSLCPRGASRNTFRFTEVIQMGLVPLSIYSDVPWIPYADLFRNIGWSSSLAQLPELLERMAQGTGDFSLAELELREKRALAVKDSHFSLLGVLDQIGRFMVQPETSDLRCDKLAPVPRGLLSSERAVV